MQSDEWRLWQRSLPTLPGWLGLAPGATPARMACLEAVEERAFMLSRADIEGFLALLTAFSWHKLPDEEVELVLRVLLQARGGRHGDLVFGETGRRLLKAAEKKHRIAAGYLEPFRHLIEAELA
jgi:hypothetical protein